MSIKEIEKLRPEDASLLQQATREMEEVLGPSLALVQMDWDRKEDAKGRPIYTLRLSDWTGSVTADFTREELATPLRLKARLYHLWGELLQIRNQKQLDDLTGAGD